MSDLNLLHTLQKVKDVIDIIDHGVEVFHEHTEDHVVATPGDENVHATPLLPPVGATADTKDLRKFCLGMALEMCWRSGDFDNLGKELDIQKQYGVYNSMFEMAKRIEAYVATGEFSLQSPPIL